MITVVGSEDIFDVRINGVQQTTAPGTSDTLSLNSGEYEVNYPCTPIPHTHLASTKRLNSTAAL